MNVSGHSQSVTQLYSLAPVGLGNGHVECLTSYIARLAAAHCVSTASLVLDEIAPIIARGFDLPLRRSELFARTGVSLNGMSGSARDVIRVLESLTGQQLSALTLVPWATLIAQKNLLKNHET